MTGYIVTTFEKDGRLAEYTAELASVPDEQGQELHLVNLYPQVRYQTFLGFGGAITEAVGLVLQALPPETARQVLIPTTVRRALAIPWCVPTWTAVIFPERIIVPSRMRTPIFPPSHCATTKGTLFPTSSWLRN